MFQIFNRYRRRGSFDGMVESILQDKLKLLYLMYECDNQCSLIKAPDCTGRCSRNPNHWFLGD
jgi:hypothetical protein